MFHALQETIGTIVEGAGERYEKLRDRPFEEVETWMSGGRGKEEDHGSGGQIELNSWFDPFPSELSSGYRNLIATDHIVYDGTPHKIFT